jgi:hypothetical protein
MNRLMAAAFGCFLCVNVPTANLAAEADLGGDGKAALECSKQIEAMFPLITVETNTLGLDRAKLRQREHAVVIPLKEPQGDVRAVRWIAKDNEDAIEFLRILRAGKVGAANVTPFENSPFEMYVAQGVSRDSVKDCQRDRILELFGKCSECEVVEWLKLAP